MSQQSLEIFEKNNSKNVIIDGITILLKLLDNVLKDPHERKYRTVRKENKIIKEKLLTMNFIYQILYEIGFSETRDQLTLPDNVNLNKLKKTRDVIHQLLDNVQNAPSSSSGETLKAPKKSTFTPIMPERSKAADIEIKSSRPYRESITFPRVLNTGNQFLQQVETLSDSVMQYEDPLLQELALKLIPLEELKLKAIKKLRKIQKLIQTGEIKQTEPCMSDLILEELVSWFKSDFFTWINKMPCKICGNEDTKPIKGTVVDGVRVERYYCCKTVSEFHRYNDIAKLLRTRSGRCGEWANCFTFLCRCLKYDARYIYSTSDHVWTEVFSVAKNRWVHVDPSENVVDSPLMYECGWKRNLTYVLGFSHDDMQDVSWRYSKDHNKMLSIRNFCTEKELVNAIGAIRKKRQQNCSAARKNYLARRTLKELLELMVVREPTENELKGRSSGSLEWRLERGEQNSNNFYVFSLLPSEVEKKEFNLMYSCAKDIYVRYVKQGNHHEVVDTKDEWTSCLYSAENIFRKVELDWKMVYLARTEGTNSAKIQWKFEFELPVKEIHLKFETKTYENGAVEISFLDENDKPLASSNDVKTRKKFSLLVKLHGGKGDVAWQHTQLFRQGKSADDYPFVLNVKF